MVEAAAAAVVVVETEVVRSLSFPPPAAKPVPLLAVMEARFADDVVCKKDRLVKERV